MENNEVLKQYIAHAASVYESSYLHERFWEDIIEKLSDSARDLILLDKLEIKDDWIRGAILNDALEYADSNPASSKKVFDGERLNRFIEETFSDPEKMKFYLDAFNNVRGLKRG